MLPWFPSRPTAASRFGLLGLMMCLTLAHVGSSLAAPSSTEPDPAREIQRRAADFRTARLDTGRRVAAVEALLEQGPEGEEAAADLFRRELGRLREGVSARPQTPELDAEIERLREILAKLRSQADLSKEQLKQVGLPALDRLTMVYRRQSAQLSRYRRDVDNLLKQLDALESVLRELKSRGTDGAAFPTDRFLAEADELRRGALTPEEREAFEVAAKNAKLAPQLEPGVVAGMNAVNAMRVMCGVRPLVYDLKLCEAATGHSADMQQHGCRHQGLG